MSRYGRAIPTPQELDRQELLTESEHQPVSFSIPLAISHRLDLLVEKTPLDTTRGEVVAALIAATATDESETLEQTILRYRKMTVGDVID